ncbi:MAG: hypothetical protein AAFP93_00025 [Bacteroidota bacterium]
MLPIPSHTLHLSIDFPRFKAVLMQASLFSTRSTVVLMTYSGLFLAAISSCNECSNPDTRDPRNDGKIGDDLFLPGSPLPRPRDPDSPGGIVNLGNTCYVNSAMQALAMFVDLFDEKLVESKVAENATAEQKVQHYKAIHARKQLARAGKQMVDSINVGRDVPSSAAREFFNALEDLGWPTPLGTQGDAGEIITLVANKLDFPSYTLVTTKSSPEGKVQKTDATPGPIPLLMPIPAHAWETSATMQEIVDDYFRPKSTKESIGKDGKQYQAIVSLCLSGMSRLHKGLLPIKLVRADYSKKQDEHGDIVLDDKKRPISVSKKIATPVNKALEITLKASYLLGEETDRNYRLVGAVHHSGSVTGGHYTAYIKKKGKWFYISDNSGFATIPEREIGSRVKSCSVFFYEPKKSP